MKFKRHIRHGHIYEVAGSEVQGWSYVRPEESNSVCRYPTRVVDLKVASDDEAKKRADGAPIYCQAYERCYAEHAG